MRIRGIVAAAILVGMASTTRAGVIEYTVAKVRTYRQTADNMTPTEEGGAFLLGQVTLDDPSDFDGFTVEGSTGASFNLDPYSFGFDWDGVDAYSSAADLDLAHPNGPTTIHASRPSGTVSETTDLTGDYPGVPYFTGSVLSDLQGLNPTQDFLLTWQPPSGAISPSGTTLSSPLRNTIFELYIEQFGFGDVFLIEGFGTTTTSVLLPGNTLAPNTTYEVALLYGDITADPRDGFTDNTDGPPGSFPEDFGVTGFGSQTLFEFTTGEAVATAPEPSSVALLLMGAMGFAGYHRRRRRLCKSVSAS